MVQAPPKPRDDPKARQRPDSPPIRGYNRRGGRPGLNVDFVAVCDVVRAARKGSGETMTSIALRFGVSRGWLHKHVYPALEE